MKVLIAPLNWGVGHATRCIPIIRKLLSEGKEVHIASDGQSLILLKAYFPELVFHELPLLNIRYTQNFPLYFKFPIIALKLFRGYQQDRKAIQELQLQQQYDAIISDNRYGVFCKGARSYIVTHQFRVLFNKIKPIEWLSAIIIKHLLKPFDTCLIPDYEGDNNLAGVISKPSKGIQYLYTKPLSRFPIDASNIPLPHYKLLIILSGPEPQRTIFEDLVVELASQSAKSIMLVRGTKEAPEIEVSKNVRVLDFAGDSMLQSLVHNSSTVIIRAGYSTIMDLNALKKGAILVPTPNQPEQEYLAKWLDGKRGFIKCHQDKHSLSQYFSND